MSESDTIESLKAKITQLELEVARLTPKPPCPECHGRGYITKYKGNGSMFISGFTSEKCPNGCQPPILMNKESPTEKW